ncbi:nitroreductase family protein [Cucumibacter marinus]|uniref:nitroreductase family protein n=1 Tax=Cucumibacter marinus TaxID=1121252 RepID=UPI0004080521|nr:nitroreductase [Cucumibacter marinus]
MPSNPELVNHLLTRRSVTLPFLKDPGPDPAQLETLLKIATRVPDHGKLAAWKLIIFEGENRAMAGQKLAEIVKRREPDATEERLAEERNRFLPAPLTIGVVSTAAIHPKIPEIEQTLSAANVCFNLLHGAHGLGFAGHWVTRWFAFDSEAAQLLGADEGQIFAGFVHIGTPEIVPGDRDRPDLGSVVHRWQG